MRIIRIMAFFILGGAAILALGAGWLSPYDYAAQYREHANEPPSHKFLFGTDELGRDRLSRLLYGSRASLICAAAAAALATALAGVIGLTAGYFGGWIDQCATAVTDLFLSLPWLFALLTLRALLPLNVTAWASIIATFLFLGAVGWAPGARVVRAGVIGIRNAGPILQARAYGCCKARLLCVHVLPNLKPVLTAQFWILFPVFLLTEANLGVLGLGVTEPMPSWGNMLAQLHHYDRIAGSPWILAPALLLFAVVASLHLVLSQSATWE